MGIIHRNLIFIVHARDKDPVCVMLAQCLCVVSVEEGDDSGDGDARADGERVPVADGLREPRVPSRFLRPLQEDWDGREGAGQTLGTGSKLVR